VGRLRSIAVDLAAGLLLTAALPPFGWWPLALVGAAVLAGRLRDRGLKGRITTGLVTGIGLLLPGLAWMVEFSPPGWVLACLIEGAFFALGCAVVPPGRWSALAFPGGLVVAEALRGAWPWGGVPIATLAQTQVGGPLAEVGRLAGPLAVAAVVGVGGVALERLVRRRWAPGIAAAALATAVVVAGIASPDGRTVGSFDVAIVQGGGPRGERSSPAAGRRTFEAHMEASQQVPPGLDLVLWPEDVVDVRGPVLESEEGARVQAVARQLDTTLAIGVVEGYRDEFRNATVALGPDGEEVDRYDKVQRVPFGEFVPFRSLVESVADVSDVPRDAAIGESPGLVHLDGVDAGVLISYEVFFARLAGEAVRAGGEVLLAPTNASSYPTAQMPSLEVAAARMRAIETGRAVVQAAPTGFSALIGPDGTVRDSTDLGDQAVLEGRVERRTGLTPYVRMGDGPLVAGALLALALAWVLTVRRRPTGRREGEPGTPTAEAAEAEPAEVPVARA
jgi:apolipoprotein N-acyltransferase